METKSKIYTDVQIDLLIGQLKGSRYVNDVQTVLTRDGHVYADGYIQRVFGKFSYNEHIWDAIQEVALNRQKKRQENAERMSQLTEEPKLN